MSDGRRRNSGELLDRLRQEPPDNVDVFRQFGVSAPISDTSRRPASVGFETRHVAPLRLELEGHVRTGPNQDSRITLSTSEMPSASAGQARLAAYRA